MLDTGVHVETGGASAEAGGSGLVIWECPVGLRSDETCIPSWRR